MSESAAGSIPVEEQLKPAGLLRHHREIAVQSNYSRLGEHLRQVTPPELQCSIFCGGRRCKYDSDTWKAEQMAIEGIYSHWVTDNILALARPNTNVIHKRNIIVQFIDKNIRTIINLQYPGEHASCGGPLGDSGFSYDPSEFMEQGIFYYNFALRDHTEPTLGGILDMVKVMAFACSEGRVAVHCHAGLGRTGVLIACYLVYSLRARANDAIRYVRMKRPNAVQTSRQILVVQEFEAFILPQMNVFCNRDKDKKNVEFTLQQFLHRQRTVLHGYEARALKHIPKIIYVICERLLKLCGCDGGVSDPAVLAPLEISYALGTPAFTSFFLSAQFDHPSSKVSYSAPLSVGSPSFCASVSRTDNIRQGSEEDSEAGEMFSEGDVTAPNSAVYPNSRYSNLDGDSPDVPSCNSGIPEQSVDHLLDDGIRNQDLAENLCYQELASQVNLRKQAELENIKALSAKEIYEALVVDHSLLSSEFKKLMKVYRLDLNVKQSSWDRLNAETDLHLLTGLLFAWLEHLKQPLFTVDNLSYIVLASHKTDVVLRKMEKEVRYSLEYLVRFVSRLQPLTREQMEAIMRRLIAAFTQQAVLVGDALLPAASVWGPREIPVEGKRKRRLRSETFRFSMTSTLVNVHPFPLIRNCVLVAGASIAEKGYTRLREGTLGKCLEFIMKFYEAVHSSPNWADEDTTRRSHDNLVSSQTEPQQQQLEGGPECD